MKMPVLAEWDKDGISHSQAIGPLWLPEDHTKEDLPDKIIIGGLEYTINK